MMTLVALTKSPIGTMEISSGENLDWKDGWPDDMKFMAVHFERVHKGIRPALFYAATEAEALAQAQDHDKKRKEKHQQWKQQAKQRRANLTQNANLSQL